MRIFILIFMLILSIGTVNAKALKDKDHIDKVAKLFTNQLQSGDIAAAYNSISPYNGLSDEQFSKRSEKGIADMTQIQNQAGKPISIAVLEKKSVDEHFYKIIHLIKYRQAAIVCEMNFYQPDQGWYLVDVSFNTDINALFD